MAVTFINKAVELKDYLIDFIKDNISDYKIQDITNGAAPEVPNVTGVHPLVLEVANLDKAEGNEYDSILPAVSVESTIINNDNLRVIGGQVSDICPVTQDWIDYLSGFLDTRERFKNGLFLTDDMIQEIQDLYDAAPGNKLYLRIYKKTIRERLTISLWADNIEVRDLLLIIIDSLFERARIASKEQLNPDRGASLRGIQLEWHTGLYNLETYGRIFFGAEGNLEFMNSISTVVVDETIASTEATDIIEKIETLKQDGNIFVSEAERP